MKDSDHLKIVNELFNAESRYNAGERDLAKLDSAWAKAALYFRTGEHFGHPAGSRRLQSLIRIHEIIEVYRLRFERGDTLSLLHAVGICADENLPLPGWLATAYRVALQSFLEVGGPASLDAVFCSDSLPADTPKKAAAARQDWQLGVELWRGAWDAVQSNDSITSLDGAVQAALSRRDYGVKKTKARALLLMVEKNQLELLGHGKSLSWFLKNRRKG